MRVPRLIRLLAGLGAILLVLGPPDRPLPGDEKVEEKPDKETERADANDLHLELSALQVLHQLRAGPAQLKAVAALSATTAPRAAPRKVVTLADGYYKTLVALRDAYAAGKDEDIDKQVAALEKAREKGDPEFDEVDITAEARKAAPGLLKKFSARQLVGYLANSGEDFPDPAESLARALERSRELKGREWRDYRDNLAYQVGWLVGGVDEEDETTARDAAAALLTRANGLDATAYKEQREALEKEARDLVGRPGPTDVIRHFLERSLAELLSNPRLPAALEGRARRPAAKPTPTSP